MTKLKTEEKIKQVEMLKQVKERLWETVKAINKQISILLEAKSSLYEEMVIVDDNINKLDVKPFYCNFCLCKDQDKCCTPVSNQYEQEECKCWIKKDIGECNC